jgi:uncharacterized membrane protein
VTPLPPLPGDIQSEPRAINDNGEVAGTSFSTRGATAVVWDGSGTPTPLPPRPGSQGSTASGITANGVVAGTAVTASGHSTAVVWDARGTPRPLPPLPGDIESTASAINANGDVAGSSGSTAVVWRGDSDDDGISDANDACPNSDLSPTVVVDGCDSGVDNALDGDGCTISDLIAEVAAGASNHGGFVSGVAHLLNDLKKAGVISGRDQGAIQRCAAQANLP